MDQGELEEEDDFSEAEDETVSNFRFGNMSIMAMRNQKKATNSSNQFGNAHKKVILQKVMDFYPTPKEQAERKQNSLNSESTMDTEMIELSNITSILP